ncbi:hypothetical protein HHK36_029652 [Tetracentron sinense]|uniref:DUF4220 domain-containing protein n=1 Tax=Tetracentron sinense TaxID=13715 RepID=A0A835D2T4_TETSI|nr:hypothetical protein HHK36_029652 [Tetracentron sinense]
MFLMEWEQRLSVLLSLLLQIILILSGKLRKRCSGKSITCVIWLAYLSADWVATFALGIISTTVIDSIPHHHNDLLILWTPFLLLHLGGPDTITAFSVEDNQLWLRHALSFMLQLIAVLYIFATSLPGSKLLFPTLFVFFSGVFKYGERIWALKRASMDGLRRSLVRAPDPGPNYAKIMDDVASKHNAIVPAALYVRREFEVYNFSSTTPLLVESGDGNNQTDSPQILTEAYRIFQTFKCLFSDLILNFQQRNHSQSIFSKCNASQAYKLIEIELNFAYDILYTKALVVHTLCGRIFRSLSFCSTLVAFYLFLFTEKHGFQKKDIIITYMLLIGALALDIVALGLLIFSDWTVVMLRSSKHYPNVKWLERGTYGILSMVRSLPPYKHRWSCCMGQYSLLKVCVQDQPIPFGKFLERMNAKEMWDHYRYTEHVKAYEELNNFIFEDLTSKSKIKEDSARFNNLNMSRGQWALEQDDDCCRLGWSIQVEFNESLLIWHIATEICFHLDKTKNKSPDQSSDYRKASRVLSHYLVYLLVARPFTMSYMAGLGMIRYGDTYAEAGLPLGDIFEACNLLMNVHTYVPPKRVKGDRSKSVLWDAVILAKDLRKLDEQKMWKITCKVWIEMLCFAARHCRGNYHAQMLSTGGELLTSVWFLEAHLGMGVHY